MRRLAGLSGSGSLQRRFTVVLILGALLFSSIVGSAAFWLAERRALASSRHALENLMTAVEKSLAIGAYAGDQVLLKEIVGGLAGHELVRSVEVRQPDGKQLAVAGDREAGAPAESAVIERVLTSPFDATERVGTVRLQLHRSRVATVAMDESLLFGGLMVGQVALVALLLYLVVAWLVSGPIVQLARALPAMEPGSERRLETPAFHRDDEIGLLVAAANALLDAHGGALQRERTLRTEVEAMEAQYRQIFDSSSAGIFVLDAEGGLINANPTVSRVIGLSREQLRNLHHGNFVRQVFARPDKVERMVEDAMRSKRTISADLELLQSAGPGGWVHCLISVQSDREASQRTVEGVIYDVTERKFSERRVRHRAEHDALTGLKNRAATQDAVERLIRDAQYSGTQFALLCIDLDGFKRVNDELGHRAGDQVLAACAARMRACVRSEIDVVGRVGGDEFIIALSGVGPADDALQTISAAVLTALCRPIELDHGHRAAIGASIGIACAPHHAADYATLAEAADFAMYEVKRTGKNAYAMAAVETAKSSGPRPPAVDDRLAAYDSTGV